MMQQYDEMQLRFDEKWGLDGETADAEERMISPQEARQISAAARSLLDGRIEAEGKLSWSDEYLKMRELGWPWRVAAYIAWAASPKGRRWPETLEAFCTQVLGLRGTRVVYTWRQKYPSIDAAVAMMQAAPLFEHRRDVIEALVQMASTPDYKAFNDRKLFLEMAGLYTPRSELKASLTAAEELTEMSDGALKRMMGDAGSAGAEFQALEDEEDSEWQAG
jgi:hypothetical protein